VTGITLETHVRSYSECTMRIPLSVHSAIEVIAAPALMAAPFLLGFGQAATAISVLIGVLLLGLALQVEGPQRTIPISAHAGFDYLLAFTAVAGGLAIGVATGEWHATVFLVGVGAAQALLTASTRFSLARSV
jgi:hypothetical protein